MHSYHALTDMCVSVVVCVARKLHPCLSYSRLRDCVDLGFLCSYGGVLARWARAVHIFLTIPHPCLFLPPLTKQSGVPSRRV